MSKKNKEIIDRYIQGITNSEIDYEDRKKFRFHGVVTKVQPYIQVTSGSKLNTVYANRRVYIGEHVFVVGNVIQ